ncbi:hypothetical protein [Ascidiimonas aurantiaca]|uniref:hypothetical protein n=1 Tax=Ascidiimonas aurantiaca TaxID=1685432 RepID=UPI0030EDA9E6
MVFIFLSLITAGIYISGTHTENDLKVKRISAINTYYTGDPIKLSFHAVNAKNLTLFCQTAYGSTLLETLTNTENTVFLIPEYLSRRAGRLTWKLIGEQNILLQGELTILANTKSTAYLEGYAGPRMLQAGGTDHFMFAIIPVDTLDNPLPDKTKVIIWQQFQEKVITDTLRTQHLVAWKNTYSPQNSGRILTTAKCNGSTFKELTIDVYPAYPENFTLKAHRNHNYADGNQITTFKTSVIKDPFGNIIADGTMVVFTVTNSDNSRLTGYGYTVNGIALTSMLHPDKKNEWKVKAYVEGIAESNEISITYNDAVKEFQTRFDAQSGTLEVGPVMSFMGQLIPDGYEIQIETRKQGLFVERSLIPTYQGKASFKFAQTKYPKGEYSVHIEAGGIKKNMNIVIGENED